MLHEETISGTTLGLLKELMSDERLDDFILVGGTSLALQIGHRISIDLDLFSTQDFNHQELSEYLQQKYNLELDFIADTTVKGEINWVQIDCIRHSYPIIGRTIVEEGIRLASLDDIAAMKLNTIAGNGTRVKDFIDLAYLSMFMTFTQMLKAYKIKYNSNTLIPIKAITYFEEINFAEPIKMIGSAKFSWKKIEKRLLGMQSFPDKNLGPI